MFTQKKKKISIKLIMLLSLVTLFSMGIPSTSEAANINSPNVGQPRKDITGWRYKKENGHLYKRMYNYSKECWIGGWILVA